MKEDNPSALPSYLSCAQPNKNRAPWYKNTAPTYAGIFLWFVFWSGAVESNTAGGVLAQGVGPALLGVLLAALICHFLFYYIPGRIGQKTGLPLYIVGTSTFGAAGGLLMPGFLMGLLQFGWVAVNIWGSSMAMNAMFGFEPDSVKLHAVMAIWGIGACVVGLKGIQYVARFSTYLPLIPAAILIALTARTLGGLSAFDPAAVVATASTGAKPALSSLGVIAFIITYIVGFFATAGAAGVDFGSNSRDKRDVAFGGLTGIALAILFTAGLSILITAGFYGTDAGKALLASGKAPLNPMNLMTHILKNDTTAKWLAFALAITAFPSACFSAVIAANSIKTTLPKVNPWISVGIGCAIAIALAIMGVAGKLVAIFTFIGASFGPICGAIVADHFLSGKRWTGPRRGFNPAGWAAWAVGFVIGIAPVQAAPLWAFIAGAVVYALCAKLGLQSRVQSYTPVEQQAAD